MAVPVPNTFARALHAYIADLKSNEDVRSPFYNEVLTQLPSSSAQNDSGKSAERLSNYIRELDAKQRKGSYTRRVSERLEPLLSGLTQFIQPFDVMIQAGPAPAALLYGGARIVLILAEKIRKCFQDVLSMMESVGHRLKCYHLFAKASENWSECDGKSDMQDLLVHTYKNILSFWQKSAALFSRKGYRTLLMGIVKPLDADWQRFRQTLDEDEKRVRTLADAIGKYQDTQRDITKTKSQQVKLRSKIIDWIKAGQAEEMLAVRQDVRTHLEIRHERSGEWLFQHPIMKKWTASNKSISLWYSAAPGAGKTILSSTVMRMLQDKGFKTVIVFCAFNDPVRKRAINILRSIALQLLAHTESIPERVKSIYEEDCRNQYSKLIDPRSAFDLIEALLKHQSRIHIVIDGLDELDGKDRDVLLGVVGSILHMKAYGIVKLFFASRPDAVIRTFMRKHGVEEVEAVSESLTEDIRKYVSARLDCDCKKCIDHWTEQANGNFLWVRHVMDILDGEGTTCEDEIEEELAKFPRGLTGAYMRSLARLSSRPERHQQLARTIFTMLVGAAQPLRLSELTHAIAALNRIPDFSPKRLPKTELIEDLCSSLVFFDRTLDKAEDPLLKLAHKSVQDFFMEDPESLQLPDEQLREYFVRSEKANLILGTACLTYLNYERYHVSQNISTIITRDDHSFLRHAATFWHNYLSRAETSTELYELTVNFVKSKAFWTCVAVQSRVAPFLFGTYSRGGYIGQYNLEASMPKLNMRCEDDICYGVPLPEWLEDESYGSDGVRIFEALHRFIVEWHQILNSHPEAVAQCAVDEESAYCFSSGVLWDDCRVKMSQLRTEETTSSGIVDVHLQGGYPQVLLLVRPISQHRYSLEKISLAEGAGHASLISPMPSAGLLTASVSDDLFFFGDVFGKGKGYWLVDTVRLSALYYSYFDGAAALSNPKTYTTEKTHGKWHTTKNPTFSIDQGLPSSARALAFHCTKDLPPRISSTSSIQSNNDSAYDSLDSPVETESELDSDFLGTNKPASQHCMFVLRDNAEPIWQFWRSDTIMETFPAFHVTEPIMLWSPSPHQLAVMDLESGKMKPTILPEPVTTDFSKISAMRKEFQFSNADNTLSYLLVTASPSTAGIKHELSFSTLCGDLSDPEVVLEQAYAPITVTYTSAGPLQQPLVLTYWTSDYLYVALPPLSCNTKIVRIRLPGSSKTNQGPHVYTLSQPAYFPYSTPYRNPQLRLLEDNPNEQFMILTLDAECSSSPGRKSSKPPAVLTWRIHPDDGWRPWSEDLDTMEKDAKAKKERYASLRGSFVDRDRRFDVPVRSGLDWRRKAFLSCA